MRSTFFIAKSCDNRCRRSTEFGRRSERIVHLVSAGDLDSDDSWLARNSLRRLRETAEAPVAGGPPSSRPAGSPAPERFDS